jgi:heme-degrading monooxygenase HmoA
MIARVWTANATPENTAKYRAHFEHHVLAGLQRVAGYTGSSLYTRPTKDPAEDVEDVEIVVITRWQSMDAIRAFAGDELDRAVVADAAVPLLTRWDQRVRHYDIVLESVPG